MSATELVAVLQIEGRRRTYARRLDLLEQTPSLLKARLYITDDLFVQVYRNDRFDTTNLVLIHNGQRLYGRDQLGGVWHRHIHTAPHVYDTGLDARRPVTLPEFLDEVESVLATMGLP